MTGGCFAERNPRIRLLTGCATRSISNSGARDGCYGRSNDFYKGELSEFDVLGIRSEPLFGQSEINAALESEKEMSIENGSGILLIQSGALMPDEAMVESLRKNYKVAFLSGIPETIDGKSYSSCIRLAAAKAGCETIVAYWGFLETTQKGLATKAVSWMPFVGGTIPDKNQLMRIRLKVAVVDVRTGQWDVFSPTAFQDNAMSARHTRESSDQDQVELLKERAYEAAAQEIATRYSKVQ